MNVRDARSQMNDYQHFTIEDGVLTKYSVLYNDVVLPSGVTKIGADVFQYCPSLHSIVIPEGVTEIDRHAFGGCHWLQSVTLPESMTTIGTWAFQDCCRLQRLALPPNVTSIGFAAFRGCRSLRYITISGHNVWMAKDCFPWNAVIMSPHLPICSFSPQYRPQAAEGFLNLYCDGKVTDPNICQSYIQYIRRNRTALCSVAVRDTTVLKFMLQEKLIGQRQFGEIFDQVSALGNAELIAALLEYKKQNFKPVGPAKKLQREWIAMEKIAEENIFPVAMAQKSWHCKKQADGSLSITEYKGSEAAVIVPKGIGKRLVTAIGSHAFSSSAVISSVVIPDGVKIIGDGAFWGCDNLRRVVIPISVTEIGTAAFDQCQRLILYGTPGSYAEEYADENGIPFRTNF